jgi:hypothetical protein
MQKVAGGFITEKYLFGLLNSSISMMHATSLMYQGTQNHIPETKFLNFSSIVKEKDMILFNLIFYLIQYYDCLGCDLVCSGRRVPNPLRNTLLQNNRVSVFHGNVRYTVSRPRRRSTNPCKIAAVKCVYS